jgi:hypothetical protein
MNITRKSEETETYCKKIIDCIKFCGKFELPLRGHDESSDSANPSVFWGLLEFAGKLDENLKSHFETVTVFIGNSKTIQNELLDCILEVCWAKIAAEIGRANFLAVVSEKTQEVVVFHYEMEAQCMKGFRDFTTPVHKMQRVCLNMFYYNWALFWKVTLGSL